MCRYSISLILLLSLIVSACGPQQSVEAPNKPLQIHFQLADGYPEYAVVFEGDTLVKPSRLGVKLKNQDDLTGPFKLIDQQYEWNEETWEPVWGQHSSIRDHNQFMRVTLEETGPLKRHMYIEFKAYDDGVAFRYFWPNYELDSLVIRDEITEFNLDKNALAWYQAADYDSYEYIYRNTKIAQIRQEFKDRPRAPLGQSLGVPDVTVNPAVNTPFTSKMPNGVYLSIHEANLTDYPGMTLKLKDDNAGFEADLVPWPNGDKARLKTPHYSPWRTIQVAKTANELLSSTMILNLNEPSKIEDTSWIKPMKYIGIWWAMHLGKWSWGIGKDISGVDDRMVTKILKESKHGANTKNTKDYIDFAAEHGFDAVLVEGWNTGWENWGKQGAFSFTESYPDFDIEEITRYAKQKEIALIGHHETGGDVQAYDAQLDAAFGFYAKHGVPAVKTGYAGQIFPRGIYHHSQYMVNHYRRVVETAAKYKITVNAHEPIKPTGIERTWPNMMTREGARGGEWDAWSEGNSPSHHVTLPFTRLLAGPMDYTPGIVDITFDRYRKENKVHTTLAKQLALMVILYSPIQMAADLPENYEGHPAFQFIKDVPVDWDELVVPHASVGEYVSIARRAGSDWFLGAATDEEGRTLKLGLGFLGEGDYEAITYRDAADAHWDENPMAYEIEKVIVNRTASLDLKLAPGGGTAISFKKK